MRPNHHPSPSPSAPAPRNPTERALVGSAADTDVQLRRVLRSAKSEDELRAAVEEIVTRGRARARAMGVSTLVDELRALGVAVPRSEPAEVIADRIAAASYAADLAARWKAENDGSLTGSTTAESASLAASTEIAQAFNAGRAELFDSVSHPDVELQWSAYLDANICDLCRAVEGDMHSRASDFAQLPPLHPACRCLLHPRRVAYDGAGVIINAGHKLRRIVRDQIG